MNISDKDKRLLLFLVVLAVFCIPYFLIIKPLHEKNRILSAEVAAARERNRYLVSQIDQEGYYNEESQEMAVNLQKMLARFPEDLPQEETLLFLSNLERKYSLSLLQVVYGQETSTGVSAGEEGVQQEEQVSASEQEAQNTEAMVKEVEASVSGAEAGGASLVSEEQVILARDLTGKCISSEYTYSVDYENWKDFLYAIEQEQNRMVITELDATLVDGDMVEGSFKMSRYAIMGAGREELEVRLPETTHGTTNLFRQAAGKGSIAGEPDFFLMLSPSEADVDAKIFGRSNDAEESTYLSSDSNDRQVITITFQGMAGNYTAMCQIGDAAYEEGGIAFEKNGMIQLEILSTPRLGEDDLAGAVVNLVNETDTTLGVTVRDDDAEDPRVDIRTKSGAILMY